VRLTKVFQDGIANYRGDARLVYASTVGLTLEFIQQSPQPVLLRAAINVGVNAMDVGGQPASVSEIQRRLFLFLVFASHAYMLHKAAPT